ncbi:MAG: hypothetical protein U1F11_06140 [Steroidobacteraceae bacterium]
MLAAAAERLGCASVAYTYNDPASSSSTPTTWRWRGERGIRNAAVVCGYVSPAPRAPSCSRTWTRRTWTRAFTEDFYLAALRRRARRAVLDAEYLRHRDEPVA